MAGTAQDASRPGALCDTASDVLVELVVAAEVFDHITYAGWPIWPKGQSGLTISLGYDIGKVDMAMLEADWGCQTV